MNNNQVCLCQKLANAFTPRTQLSLLVHTWDMPQQFSKKMLLLFDGFLWCNIWDFHLNRMEKGRGDWTVAPGHNSFHNRGVRLLVSCCLPWLALLISVSEVCPQGFTIHPITCTHSSQTHQSNEHPLPFSHIFFMTPPLCPFSFRSFSSVDFCYILVFLVLFFLVMLYF